MHLLKIQQLQGNKQMLNQVNTVWGFQLSGKLWFGSHGFFLSFQIIKSQLNQKVLMLYLKAGERRQRQGGQGKISAELKHPQRTEKSGKKKWFVCGNNTTQLECSPRVRGGSPGCSNFLRHVSGGQIKWLLLTSGVRGNGLSPCVLFTMRSWHRHQQRFCGISAGNVFPH